MGLSSVLTVLIGNAEIVDAQELTEAVARDPDDDKFLACAEAADVSIIVTGDRDLQSLDIWRNVSILSPRRFVDEYLHPEAS